MLALTDHDTTAGWAEAVAARPPGLALVRGAELSCAFRAATGSPVGVHLLAYLFDPSEPDLAAARRRVRRGRLDRGRRIVELLRAGRIAIDWDEVAAGAAGGTIGRPHIARELVRLGCVPNLDAAFGPDWLGTHGRYWAAKEEIDVLEAVRLVHAAGGAAVLAHPGAGRRGPVVDRAAITALAAAGLDGLEVDHQDHPVAQRRQLARLADELNLFATGGSDYHGSNKAVRLGEQLCSPAAFDRLLAATRGCPVVTG